MAPSVGCETGYCGRRIRAATYPFKRAYNQARAEIGLPRDRRPYGSVLFSDWLVLATGCPSLDVPRADLPAQVHFVGRLGPAGTAFTERSR